ncbi:2-oxo-hept-4-ene-1,7-dioate hydratase [Variovorax boronicumulans]|uniref:2-oxo-hept-4-ene-1,7-dioate hydratase n=1 Tax=Variovorax boronicumulans TaxID=436515 RepID=UPI003391479D
MQHAEHDRVQLHQLHLQFPSMTIDDAYAIQREWIGLKLAAGQRLVGHKIGLTSKAMQASVGIDEPDFGALLDEMLFENGTQVPFDRFIEPRVEIELAFILGKKLEGPHCTKFDVLSATEYVVPAVEIIDSRIQRVDPDTKSVRTILDSVSDNAITAGVVLGDRPVRPMDIDLRWVAGLLYRNGQIEETGVAAGVLNHPANSAAWLANKLAQHGEFLLPGQIILAGSFTRAVVGNRGDTFQADYGPLGAVSFQFV